MMQSEEEIDVQEMIRSGKATMRVFAITSSSADDDRGTPKGDPRFVSPGARSRIKEDSGTYSVVYKKVE